MTTWEVILLGFVQGATEFLPVSSSGHLVIAQAIMGIDVDGVLFEIAVHVATLLSILVVYRNRIARLTRGVISRDPDSLRYVGLLFVASIPAGLLGVFAREHILGLFESPIVPGVALLVTGAVLWSSRSVIEGAVLERPSWRGALLIGIAQAFALIPGISRSGSTVVAALWLGVSAEEAAAFSFLMAVPAIGGAALVQVLALGTQVEPGVGALLIGAAVAAVPGVLAIRTFVAMLAKRSFHFFAPYCLAVGAAYLAFVWMG